MEDNVKVLTLDSIPTLKQLIGNGGEAPTIYNGFTNDPEGVMSASFWNSLFNSAPYGNLILGGRPNPLDGVSNSARGGIALDPSGASLNGNYSVSIGKSPINNGSYGIAIGAETTVHGHSEYNPTTQGAGMAIGPYAKTTTATANNKPIYPVALGFGSVASARSEVSIGNPNVQSPDLWSSIAPARNGTATRYVANVTAGELDTDATNVAQVREAVIGDVLYTGTEAVSEITLSASVAQYEQVELIGTWTLPYQPDLAPLQVIVHWQNNDQDQARVLELHAHDMDVAAMEKAEVTDIWQFTAPTTLSLVSSISMEGSATDPTIESHDTPLITITKVIGRKAI